MLISSSLKKKMHYSGRWRAFPSHGTKSQSLQRKPMRNAFETSSLTSNRTIKPNSRRQHTKTHNLSSSKRDD